MRLNSLFYAAGPAAALAIPHPVPKQHALRLDPYPHAAPRPTEIAEPIPVACLRHARDAAARGDIHTALAWTERAIALDPGLSIAHACRAMLLAQLERDVEAGDAITAAVEGNPREAPHARIALARATLQAGDAPLAIKNLAAALAHKPSLADAVLRDEGFAGLRDHPHFLQLTGAL